MKLECLCVCNVRAAFEARHINKMTIWVYHRFSSPNSPLIFSILSSSYYILTQCLVYVSKANSLISDETYNSRFLMTELNALQSKPF